MQIELQQKIKQCVAKFETIFNDQGRFSLVRTFDILYDKLLDSAEKWISDAREVSQPPQAFTPLEKFSIFWFHIWDITKIIEAYDDAKVYDLFSGLYIARCYYAVAGGETQTEDIKFQALIEDLVELTRFDYVFVFLTRQKTVQMGQIASKSGRILNFVKIPSQKGYRILPRHFRHIWFKYPETFIMIVQLTEEKPSVYQVLEGKEEIEMINPVLSFIRLFPCLAYQWCQQQNSPEQFTILLHIIMLFKLIFPGVFSDESVIFEVFGTLRQFLPQKK